MSLPIVLRDAASAEFDEAFDDYENHHAGLGVDFMLRVQDIFNRISEKPQVYPVVLGDIRKAVVRRFPYCVFYRAHASHIEILAIFHSKRDPANWQSRK